ncbi:MAG: hypothetical protein [brine shrimp arlivirus 6]|nr:MAG: hypothetical protein [brine shrimp arlivirus 6]UNI74101.1 MAG: hypothetical protein [brine shrimp arlivirus 6]UNI74106.1 MAG: hypothetical protein [brine shrimp arlivirus 6]UNI74111.1 MAG: hypothetical protein [brine shrimp arlivirus 6]
MSRSPSDMSDAVNLNIDNNELMKSVESFSDILKKSPTVTAANVDVLPPGVGKSVSIATGTSGSSSTSGDFTPFGSPLNLSEGDGTGNEVTKEASENTPPNQGENDREKLQTEAQKDPPSEVISKEAPAGDEKSSSESKQAQVPTPEVTDTSRSKPPVRSYVPLPNINLLQTAGWPAETPTLPPINEEESSEHPKISEGVQILTKLDRVLSGMEDIQEEIKLIKERQDHFASAVCGRFDELDESLTDFADKWGLERVEDGHTAFGDLENDILGALGPKSEFQRNVTQLKDRLENIMTAVSCIELTTQNRSATSLSIPSNLSREMSIPGLASTLTQSRPVSPSGASQVTGASTSFRAQVQHVSADKINGKKVLRRLGIPSGDETPAEAFARWVNARGGILLKTIFPKAGATDVLIAEHVAKKSVDHVLKVFNFQ